MLKRFLVCLLSVLMLLGPFGNGRFANCVAEDDSGAAPEETASCDYQYTLFDTGVVHQIDIVIPEEDWDDLLANPTAKTKYRADITIDGEEIKNVSFATKGNSSLFFVADDPESIRYSFKVNFGKYAKGQRYHGLDKLNLNNNFGDATGLRDYLSYETFRKAGVPAPLTSFVWLRINGNDHGLYLAVEDVGDSFLNRVYGGDGVIYKPESESLDLTLDDISDIRENGLQMTGECHGADLVYTDDDIGSYPDIFKNAETDADDTAAERVVAALKGLAEEENLEEYLDTDQIVRFFAAHNFLLNDDSYTGGMLHNLILYENNGKLSLLPWDYNSAFGTFTASISGSLIDATDMVNRGIDSPLAGAAEEDRPMWKWIIHDGTYLERYHQALGSLVSEYFESGEFDRELMELYGMLLPYVEKDPTAFNSADEYRSGCETLRQFAALRTESVKKQLSGELETVSELQTESDQVDASGLRVQDLSSNLDLGNG